MAFSGCSLNDLVPMKGSKETVLLIEDEHSVGSFAEDALQKHVYRA